MSNGRIKIKAVNSSPRRIKIKKRFLSANDLKVLTQNILKLNTYSPLQQSTLQDLFDKTAVYINRLQPSRNNSIKIKKIRLFNNAN